MSKYGINPLKRLKEVSSLVSSAGKKSSTKQSSNTQNNKKQDNKKQDNKKQDSSKQAGKRNDAKQSEKKQDGNKQDAGKQSDKQTNKKQQSGKLAVSSQEKTNKSKLQADSKQSGKKQDGGKQSGKQDSKQTGKQDNKQSGKKTTDNKQDNKNKGNNKKETKNQNKKQENKQENNKDNKHKIALATKASMAAKAAKKAADDNDRSAEAGTTSAMKAATSKKAAGTAAHEIAPAAVAATPAITASMKASKKNKQAPTKIDLTIEKGETIKIIPLGGLEQIGLNITAFEHDDSIIVVDCGIAFPTEEMLGIDCVIPDVTYLKDNIHKVKAFFITHGHEDHIGALPYILKEINVPVYGTKLTMALIEHKLKEHGLLESAKLRTVKHRDSIKAGDFKVEFVMTNHSISDASALAIFTPAGTIFHTGDFKIDYTPIYGEPADLQRMAEIGNMGCLALMCDSTNAFREGSTASEKTVGKRIDTIFAEHPDNRIIAASFASNVDRVQQFINVAHKYGRKVVVEGRSMEQIIEVAGSLGYLKIPEGTLIGIDQLKNYQPKNTVIITTGSQGESMAALSRMASGTHKKVVLGEGDVVVMSSKTIPGNEKAVAKVINDLYMKGAEVILHDTHVSGHACQEDLKLIYALLKPKYVVPVHGEYMHLVAQKELALTMGIPNKNICIMSSGDVLEIGDNRFKVVDHVESGPVMVEGLSIGDVGNVVLKDRQSLAQNGIIVVSMAVQLGTGELVGGPELITRGFIYEKENEDLIRELQQVVYDEVESLTGEGTDINKLINETRDKLKSYLWKSIKRTPVILVNVLQLNV